MISRSSQLASSPVGRSPASARRIGRLEPAALRGHFEVPSGYIWFYQGLSGHGWVQWGGRLGDLIEMSLGGVQA